MFDYRKQEARTGTKREGHQGEGPQSQGVEMRQCEAGSGNAEHATQLEGEGGGSALERQIEPEGEGLECYAMGLQTTLPGGPGECFFKPKIRNQELELLSQNHFLKL